MSFIFLHWSLNEYATDFKIIYRFLILQVHPDVTITTVHKIMRDRLKLLWRRHLVTE